MRTSTVVRFWAGLLVTGTIGYIALDWAAAEEPRQDVTARTIIIFDYWGHEPGARFELFSDGRLEIRRGKRCRWDSVEQTLQIPNATFEKLVAAASVAVQKYPIEGYEPKKGYVSDPTFYSLFVGNGRKYESVVFEGVDGENSECLQEIDALLRSLRDARPSVRVWIPELKQIAFRSGAAKLRPSIRDPGEPIDDRENPSRIPDHLKLYELNINNLATDKSIVVHPQGLVTVVPVKPCSGGSMRVLGSIQSTESPRLFAAVRSAMNLMLADSIEKTDDQPDKFALQVKFGDRICGVKFPGIRKRDTRLVQEMETILKVVNHGIEGETKYRINIDDMLLSPP